MAKEDRAAVGAGGSTSVWRCRKGDTVTVSGCASKPVVRRGSDGSYYVSVSANRKTKIKTKGVDGGR